MLLWSSSELYEIDEVFGCNLFHNGVQAKRNALEAMLEALYNPCMIPEKVRVNDFAPVRGQG